MKRVLLHISFWLLYLCQDVVLIILVDASRLPGFSQHERIIMAIENCCVSLMPKLLFTYFILYVTLDKIVEAGAHFKTSIFYSILAFIGTLLLYRTLVIYFIDPVIYGWSKNTPAFFDTLGFLVALMDIGFASGAAIVIKQVRLQLSAKEKERDLIKSKLETELKFLRNQINPHFLFNTLNNIYALANKKSDETPGAVIKLSRLLQFMLYETKKPSIKIGDEIKMLDNYIELQKIRYDDRLSISFLREIDEEREHVSPLLLLPFLENAFKHGIGESRFKSFINIDMQLKNSVLNFNIENTNENYNSQIVDENIGFKNVKRQLELMYKDYDIDVQNDPELFKVSLRINLQSKCKN